MLGKGNLDGLDELGAFLASYKARGGKLHAWHLYRFLPLGRGGSLNAPSYALEEGDFERAGSGVKAAFPELKIYLRPDMYHSKSVSFYWSRRGGLQSLGPNLKAFA
jgi:hypothetical protein